MKPLPKTPDGGVRLVEIDANHAGQRLDNYLLSALKGVPRSRIYRIVRTGEVRVNGGRARPSTRLAAGDKVRIPPVRLGERPEPASAERRAWLLDRIIYEDDAILAIDKPSGLSVHAGSGVTEGVIETLRALRPDLPYLELVHRLDRETSGCLLLAKNRHTLTSLHAALRDGMIEKHYLALVRGPWRGGPRRVRASLARTDERVLAADDGKEAESIFTPRERFSGATLVDIELLTGRTHQARVHAAHIDHPIAGDDKYGDRQANREFRSRGLKRIFLHAASLRFMHPVREVTMTVESPLPAELQKVLTGLRQ